MIGKDSKNGRKGRREERAKGDVILTFLQFEMHSQKINFVFLSKIYTFAKNFFNQFENICQRKIAIKLKKELKALSRL